MEHPVREFRKLHRLKIRELAKASGLDASILSKIELYYKDFSDYYLNKLIEGFKTFGIDASSLKESSIPETKKICSECHRPVGGRRIET